MRQTRQTRQTRSLTPRYCVPSTHHATPSVWLPAARPHKRRETHGPCGQKSPTGREPWGSVLAKETARQRVSLRGRSGAQRLVGDLVEPHVSQSILVIPHFLDTLDNG